VEVEVVKARASITVKAEKKEIILEHASAMKTWASVRVKVIQLGDPKP